jgi:hypothetical protein
MNSPSQKSLNLEGTRLEVPVVGNRVDMVCMCISIHPPTSGHQSSLNAPNLNSLGTFLVSWHSQWEALTYIKLFFILPIFFEKSSTLL